MEEAREGVWVGVDWGDGAHSVTVISETKEVVRKSWSVENCAAGLNELVSELLRVQPVRGVAVESTNALVVSKLLESGFPVYMINPKVSNAWRACEKPSEAKCDSFDAYVLAINLKRRHAELTALKPNDDATRALMALCADEQAMVAQRTALINQVTSLLKLIFPQAVEWLDLSTTAAWKFLLEFPTYETFQKAKLKDITRVIKFSGMRYTQQWQDRIDRRAQADAWPIDKPTVPSRTNYLNGLCKQLCVLQETLSAHRALIKEAFSKHPDHDIFDSLPGAGESLAPRMLALFGSNRDNFDNPDIIRCIAGAAPVTFQSGDSKTVSFRNACNKRHRNTIQQFAGCSVMYCDWAQAFYNKCKATGKRHNTILRNLSGKWIEIVFRMWKNRTPYDAHKHICSLIKHGSPIVKAMGPQTATT